METEWIKRSSWGNHFHTFGRILNNVENSKQSNFLQRGIIPIGNGRSYGDSALNSGGYLVSSSEQSEIFINPTNKTVLVGSGVLLEHLENELLKHNLYLPVVPGTGKITIGGAIAADVHGKSHHKQGSFGNHLHKIKIVTPNFEELELLPSGETSDYFWATIGGMGLTGQILEAEIQLITVQNEFISSEEIRFRNLNEALEIFENFNEKYHYTVAWLDISGKYAGRGKISGGNHAAVTTKGKKISGNYKIPKKISIPQYLQINIISKSFIKLFNLFWFHKPLKNGLIEIQKFMHPLDSIDNWNYAYGKNGFIQYQFVIPPAHSKALQDVLDILRNYKVHSFLCVLKKFGPGSQGFLSFPMEGWTMTIDISKNHSKLFEVVSALDEKVIESRGRVYLAKDSFLTPWKLTSMYEHLDSWLRIKRKIDPENLWRSDQGRRVGLC